MTGGAGQQALCVTPSRTPCYSLSLALLAAPYHTRLHGHRSTRRGSFKLKPDKRRISRKASWTWGDRCEDELDDWKVESAAGGLWNSDRAGFVYIYKVKATNVFCSNCISFKFSKLGGKNKSHYQLLFSCPHRRLSEAEEVDCLRGLDCGVNR